MIVIHAAGILPPRGVAYLLRTAVSFSDSLKARKPILRLGHVRLRYDMPLPPPGRRRIDLFAARDEATFAWHDSRRPDRQLPPAKIASPPPLLRRILGRVGLAPT